MPPIAEIGEHQGDQDEEELSQSRDRSPTTGD